MIRRYTDILDAQADTLKLMDECFTAEHGDILFFDIETTGLSKDKDSVYLAGAICIEDSRPVLRQWFADRLSDEQELIKDFMAFAAPYKQLVSYNGDRFDLPFLTARCEALGINGFTDDNVSIDLYRMIAPYKSVLGVPDCKQHTMELFLGINRTDTYSGGELTKVYRKYQKKPDKQSLDDMVLHNADDLRGLLALTPLMIYDRFFRKMTEFSAEPVSTDEALPKMELPIRATRAQADTYAPPGVPEVNLWDTADSTEISKNATRSYTELVIRGHISRALPSSIGASADGCFFQIEGDAVTVKVPVLKTELKYFYSNYRDYYYLPAEDQAIHKSIAAYADKTRRVQANASNCYTRKAGNFLMQFDLVFTPFFKKSYEDKKLYFELTQSLSSDRTAMALYATIIISHIIKKA